MNEQQQAEAWFALEFAVGRWSERPAFHRVNYGAPVWGGCLEPGDCLLQESWMGPCPDCGRFRCETQWWEAAEAGSLNSYSTARCDACGYSSSDDDEDGYEGDRHSFHEDDEFEAALPPQAGLQAAYVFDAVCLWVRGRISWPTLRLVLKTGQPAAWGARGAEIICRKTRRALA